MGLKNPETHFQNLEGRLKTRTSPPTDPQTGDMYYHSTLDDLEIYDGSAWYAVDFTTTTSTSTSTTTTSTSTTTTSTSTSTTTSTSTSTTTSTTTTI
jgi:hypothetical protein